MILSQNNFEFDINYLNEAKSIIELHMLAIKKNYNNEYISPLQYEDYLIVISKFLSIADSKAKNEYIEIGYNLAKGIRQKLELEYDFYKEPSMSSGLGYMCFSIHLFNKATGLLGSFLKTLNKLLLDRCYSKVSSLMINNMLDTNTRHEDYDLANGASGVLYYLLDFDWEDTDFKKIKVIGDYLITLSYEYEYDGLKVPKFHVKPENISNSDDKEIFQSGSLDFSIAHGIIGPLITLAKLKCKTKGTKQLDVSINNILSLYNKFEMDYHNVILWPTQLSINENLNKVRYSNQTSISNIFCGLSIANGLKNVSIYLENNILIKKYDNIMKNILIYDYNMICLSNSIGHRAYLDIMISTYKETSDDIYLDNLYKTLSTIFDSFDPSLKHGFGFESFEDIKIDNISFSKGTSCIILSLIGLLSNKSSNYENFLFLC